MIRFRMFAALATALFFAGCGAAEAGDPEPEGQSRETVTSAPTGSPAATAPTTAAASVTATSSTTARATPTAATAPGRLPAVVVYKTPSCGCCNGWIEHLQAAGFEVDARNLRDLMSIKRDAGVPLAMSSCHTALVDGYVVEGHVPIDEVLRMLAERPDIAGIGVPGMPIGSPGMEGPNAKPYQVFSFDADGNAGVWAEIDPR